MQRCLKNGKQSVTLKFYKLHFLPIYILINIHKSLTVNKAPDNTIHTNMFRRTTKKINQTASSRRRKFPLFRAYTTTHFYYPLKFFFLLTAYPRCDQNKHRRLHDDNEKMSIS